MNSPVQPIMYWYPPPGQGSHVAVSPQAANAAAYLMPTCATPATGTPGLAQVPDVLTVVDGVYEVSVAISIRSNT